MSAMGCSGLKHRAKVLAPFLYRPRHETLFSLRMSIFKRLYKGVVESRHVCDFVISRHPFLDEVESSGVSVHCKLHN